MQVGRNKVVSFDYTLKSNDGTTIDSSQGRTPLVYLHGAGGLVPGVEAALEGKSAGDKLSVSVPPEQGYGQKNPQLVQDVPKHLFQGASEIRAGMQFQAQTQQGPRLVTVVAVQDETVRIDANHPLAGQTLNFDLSVVDVRDATPEELAHGHAHGPGGQHH